MKRQDELILKLLKLDEALLDWFGTIMFNQIIQKSQLNKIVMSVDDFVTQSDIQATSIFNWFHNYKDSIFLGQETIWLTIKINFYAMLLQHIVNMIQEQ